MEIIMITIIVLLVLVVVNQESDIKHLNRVLDIQTERVKQYQDRLDSTQKRLDNTTVKLLEEFKSWRNNVK